MRKRLWWILLVGVVLTAGALYAGTSFLHPRTTIHIAYITTRPPDTDNQYVRICDTLLALHVAQLNREFKDVHIELTRFNNARKAENHLRIYDDSLEQKLPFGEHFSLVIDNGFGSHLAHAREKIANKGIPVIAMNGDHNGLPYGKDVLFTAYDDDVPDKFTALLEEILEARSVVLIGEADYSMNDTMMGRLQERGIDYGSPMLLPKFPKVAGTDHADTLAGRLLVDSLMHDLVRKGTLADSCKGRTILLNVHSDYGTPLLRWLRTNARNATFLTPIYSISSDNLEGGSAADTGNVIYTIANRFADLSLAASKRRLGDDPIMGMDSVLSATFQRKEFAQRCIDVANLIRYALSDPKAKAGPDIRGRLAALREGPTYINNVYYAFDARGLMQRTFTVLKVTDRARPNVYQLDKDLNKRPAAICGAQLRKVRARALERDQFDVEVEYWVSLLPDVRDMVLGNESDHQNVDHGRPRISSVIALNSTDPTGVDVPIGSTRSQEGLIEERYLRRMSVVGAFDYQRYPFDQQDLQVSLDFVSQDPGLLVVVDSRTFDRVEEAKVDAPSYEPIGRDVEVQIESGADQINASKRTITFNVRLDRKFLAPFVGLTLPSFLIALAACFIMLFMGLDKPTMVQAGVALLLVAITSSIPLVQITPQVGSLKLLDVFYLLMLYAVVASCVVAAFRHFAVPMHSMTVRRIGVVICCSYVLSCVAAVFLWGRA